MYSNETCADLCFPPASMSHSLSPPAPPSIVNGVFSGNLRTPWSVRIADKKAEKVFPLNSVWQASLMKYGNFCHTSVTLQKLPIRLMETNYILLDMLSSFWNRKKKNHRNPSLAELFPHCAICYNPSVPRGSCPDCCLCGDLCVCTRVHACVCSRGCVSLFVPVSAVICVCM